MLDKLGKFLFGLFTVFIFPGGILWGLIYVIYFAILEQTYVGQKQLDHIQSMKIEANVLKPVLEDGEVQYREYWRLKRYYETRERQRAVRETLQVE